MSTFTVSNTLDSGSGSLRQAISKANTSTGFDIINFNGVFGDNVADIITLGGSSLIITDDLSIKGTSADLLTVSGNNASRVFEISSGVTVKIKGLTIANGYSNQGGGIYNSGSLALSNSTVSDSEATDYIGGGGIGNASSGIMTIANSTISGNTVNSDGGGISNSGIMTIATSIISDNTGSTGGGIANGGSLTLSNSTVSSNSAVSGSLGGGIFNGSSSIMTITNSIISDNRAYDAGGILNNGTLIVNNSTISSNTSSLEGVGDGGGGGIYSDGGSVMLNNSTIKNNYAYSGGGILNLDSSVMVNNSIISGNTAYVGGGISNGGNPSPGGYNLTVSNSTITGNTAEFGGGINNGVYYTATVINSTISGNRADTSGGGIDNNGRLVVNNSTISSNTAYDGGGIYNNGGLTVNNSTITLNSVNYNAEVPDYYKPVAGIHNLNRTTVVNNSIIAGNFDRSNNDPTNVSNSDVKGDFISNGFNLIGSLNGSTGFNANEQLNVPLTEIIDTTLRDNGGATKTHALVIGSKAINAGKNADIPADTTDLDGDGNTTEKIAFDQRGSGYNRISGGRVDIGAFEAVVNVINGTPGRDTIKGTAGNDIITGFQGRDILTGGEGADTFVYTSIRDVGDAIADFKVGTDKIVFRQLFQSFGLDNLNFATAIAGGYLRFETLGNNTIVLIDPDGSSGQGRAIKFLNLNKVSATAANNSTNFAF